MPSPVSAKIMPSWKVTAKIWARLTPSLSLVYIDVRPSQLDTSMQSTVARPTNAVIELSLNQKVVVNGVDIIGCGAVVVGQIVRKRLI